MTSSKCCCLLVVLITVACHVLPSPSQGAARGFSRKNSWSGDKRSESIVTPVMRRAESVPTLHEYISEDAGKTSPTESFDSIMKPRPAEWCYNARNAETPWSRLMHDFAAPVTAAALASPYPHTFRFDHVVSQTRITAGEFNHFEPETFTCRSSLLDARAAGANNGGVYVVEHNGDVLLMKTMENAPFGMQDNAKSTTREAYVQAVAAQANLIRHHGHDPSAGVVPRIRFAGLEDVWNPTSFLVMDYIDPLTQLHASHDTGKYTMDDHQFLSVAHSLMDVVSRMLDAGVSHNDIAMRNIIILVDERKNYRVALIDFGESCLLFFGRDDRVADDFRERFSCHLFKQETHAPKCWVKQDLHSAGYRDVHATFRVLGELLSETDGGVSHAPQFAEILRTAVSEIDHRDVSIYSGLPIAQSGGGTCIYLMTPVARVLGRVHAHAREETGSARLLLEVVKRKMSSILEGSSPSDAIASSSAPRSQGEATTTSITSTLRSQGEATHTGTRTLMIRSQDEASAFRSPSSLGATSRPTRQSAASV